MIYRSLYHCLSRHIPHLDVHKVYPFMTILVLDLHILKKFNLWLHLPIVCPSSSSKSIKIQMLTQSSILSSYCEDKNDVRIPPSQPGRIYSFLYTWKEYIQAPFQLGTCVEISCFPPRFSVSPYFSHIVKCPFPYPYIQQARKINFVENTNSGNFTECWKM